MHFSKIKQIDNQTPQKWKEIKDFDQIKQFRQKSQKSRFWPVQGKALATQTSQNAKTDVKLMKTEKSRKKKT